MINFLILRRGIYYAIGTFALFFPLIIHAQLAYPIVGQYKNKSAQGMAIWGDNAYLMNVWGTKRGV